NVNGNPEERRQQRRQPVTIAHMARQQAGKKQLRKIRHGIAIAQSRFTDPDERSDIEREAILLRTIEARRKLRLRPGAIEKLDKAVMQNVQKTREGTVARMYQPVSRVFGQMQRQRTVRSQQTEKTHFEPR